MKRAWFLFLASSFTFKIAQALPELIRHGYTTCISCHISPNGGGVLTPYGRSLSKELVSTWGREGEEQVLYGAIPYSEKLALGGNFRFLQTYRDTNNTRTARFFPMQMALEAVVYSHSSLGVNGMLAYERASEAESKSGRLISPQHYFIYTPSTELVFRLGKFQRPFGINTPEHFLASRTKMGLGPGTESYHLEVTQLKDNYEVVVAGTLGSLDSTQANERGVTVRPQLILGTVKLGFSYAFLKSTDATKHQVGPFFVWGITNSLTASGEFDFEWREDDYAYTRSNQNYVKVFYEVFRGVAPYTLYEMDWNKLGDVVHRPGLGLQLFPRPHSELNLLFQKTLGPANQNIDQALLMLHYYL